MWVFSPLIAENGSGNQVCIFIFFETYKRSSCSPRKRILMHSFSSESTQVFMFMAPRVMNIALLWVGVWSGWKGKHLCICESVCHALLCVTYKGKSSIRHWIEVSVRVHAQGEIRNDPLKASSHSCSEHWLISQPLHGPVHLSVEHSACLRVFGHLWQVRHRPCLQSVSLIQVIPSEPPAVFRSILCQLVW